MNTNKKTARIAGIFYLLVAIFGGFAEGFLDPKIYVGGNAIASAGNLIANAGLVKFGVIAHLLDGVFFVLVAITLYSLLQHVSKWMAKTMLILVVISAAITSLNSVFLFEGLQVARDGQYVAAFGVNGSNAIAYILLDIEHYGIFIAQVFFGLWLVPLGWLAIKSEIFPKWLGYLLISGGVCYIIDLLAAFLAPELFQKMHGFIVIIPAIAEISMVFYLLIVGVKGEKAEEALVD